MSRWHFLLSSAIMHYLGSSLTLSLFSFLRFKLRVLHLITAHISQISLRRFSGVVSATLHYHYHPYLLSASHRQLYVYICNRICVVQRQHYAHYTFHFAGEDAFAAMSLLSFSLLAGNCAGKVLWGTGEAPREVICLLMQLRFYVPHHG